MGDIGTSEGWGALGLVRDGGYGDKYKNTKINEG